ncbi:hypothetical protein P168DRAFT_330662 [Aspergillus campestris IBT 28561]|uniref:Dickkopf N-terminal cysteine-rich domain-containing protein n=1 Tax=Aspergillus campestris (strain IBT 28561) TaxID=1392248 RepID=A0A2I1CR86_ASPC2|nr:uncharacterized protein P168DRAFT_330662 [Aspergillus campestris IBT 28561]PKY00133.1 hypothetical protein P168DRAFT_330662 [Aspergillus campestris IBT 28561]
MKLPIFLFLALLVTLVTAVGVPQPDGNDVINPEVTDNTSILAHDDTIIQDDGEDVSELDDADEATVYNLLGQDAVDNMVHPASEPVNPKRDPQCPRRCRIDDRGCCHTDMCWRGYCSGPGKLPMTQDVKRDVEKRDPRCRRACSNDSGCCHSDTCSAGVCLGPGRWPLAEDVESVIEKRDSESAIEKRDPRCRRACSNSAGCCHTDTCSAGVCLGPGKWPRAWMLQEQ